MGKYLSAKTWIKFNVQNAVK